MTTEDHHHSFETLFPQVHSTQNETVHKIGNDSMVLFNKDQGKPLAGLTFRAAPLVTTPSSQVTRKQANVQNSGPQNLMFPIRSLICELDRDPMPDEEILEAVKKAMTPEYEKKQLKDPLYRFQGLINKDDVPIWLGITNFSSDSQIMFDLFLTDQNNSSPSTGPLNEITVLNPKQTYWVQSNQWEGNTKLILKGLTQEKKLDDGSITVVPLTVKEAEAKPLSNKGIYIRPVVYGEKKNSQLFKNTEWRVPVLGCIIIESPKRIATEVTMRGTASFYPPPGSASFGSSGVPMIGSAGDGDTGFFGQRVLHSARVDGAASGLSAFSAATSRRPWYPGDRVLESSRTHERHIRGNMSQQEHESAIRDPLPATDSGGGSWGSSSSEEVAPRRSWESEIESHTTLSLREDDDNEGRRRSVRLVNPSPPRSFDIDDVEFSIDADGDEVVLESRSETLDNPEDKSAELWITSVQSYGGGSGTKGHKKGRNTELVAQSQACELKKNDEVVKVQGTRVTTEFDQTHTNDKTIIGLSCETRLQFDPFHESIKMDDILETIKLYKERKYEHLFKATKVYPSITCAICLEENEPTVTLYQCGHQCLCSNPECNSHDLKQCPLCRAKIQARLERPRRPLLMESLKTELLV